MSIFDGKMNLSVTSASDMAILRWENGKSDITGENLKKLAEFFNVTTDYLLGLTDANR